MHKKYNMRKNSKRTMLCTSILLRFHSMHFYFRVVPYTLDFILVLTIEFVLVFSALSFYVFSLRCKYSIELTWLCNALSSHRLSRQSTGSSWATITTTFKYSTTNSGLHSTIVVSCCWTQIPPVLCLCSSKLAIESYRGSLTPNIRISHYGLLSIIHSVSHWAIKSAASLQYNSMS